MNASYLQDIWDILIQPVASFEKFRFYTLSRSYRLYVLLLIGNSVLSGIVSVLFGLYMIRTGADFFRTVPFLGPFIQSFFELFRYFLIDVNLLIIYAVFITFLVLVFLIGFYLHIFVILLDGGKGVSLTLRTVMHATTPFFLFGWIPYLGLIGLFWAIILCITGIKTMHEIPWWKAVAIVFIPVMLFAIMILVAFILVLKVTGRFSLLL